MIKSHWEFFLRWILFVLVQNFLSLEYANVHYENQKGGFKMKCFLNMFDHRELPGHKPSLVSADMCKERQVDISCLTCFERKNGIDFFFF